MSEPQKTPKTVRSSTVEALRSLDGTIAWGRPGLARRDFRSIFSALVVTEAG